MNNRQGANSRLPYNSRAFSPQRMMGSSSNNNFSSYPSSSSYNQQSSSGGFSSNDYRGSSSTNNTVQPFYQYRNEINRNDNYSNQRNQGRDTSGIWDGYESNSSSSRNYQQSTGNYSGYDSNNRSSLNSNFNNQFSNYGSSPNMVMDLFTKLGNVNSQQRSSGFDQQQRSNFSNNFHRSSNQNPPQRSSNWNQNATQRSNEWNQNKNARNDQKVGDNRSDKPSQKPPQKPGQNFNQSNQTQNSKTDASQLKPRKEREIFPDIGEPTINPKFKQIFKVTKVTPAGAKVYNCLVCKIFDVNEKSILDHQTGKKHKYHLKSIEDQLPGPTKADKKRQFKEYINARNYTHKPEFEEIIKPVEMPLVALEYLIEVLDSNAKENVYFCALCNKRMDPRTVVNHLVSQTHRMKYLDKHFTRIFVRCKNYRRFNEDQQFRQEVLVKICSRIDTKSGRSTAFLYEGTDFEHMKDDIFENVQSKQHITIDDFPNAENTLLEGVELSNAQWEAENEPLQPKPKPVKLELPVGVKRKRKVPANVMTEYHTKVEMARRQLERDLEEYEKDPDSHPHYKKEWELFWNKKVDEMSKRGLDPTGHNFHDEWCDYFLKRIRDLHKEEVWWKTDQIRKSLGLLLEDLDGETDNKRSRLDSHESDDREELFKERKGRFYVSDEDGDDSFDEDYREFGPRIPKDVLYVKEEKIFTKFLNTVGIDGSKSQDRSSNKTSNLIATCRLLSTLEKELGLLAPKVLDLLSKAIAFERDHSKSADEMIFDPETLNLMETVKEKILGLQMAHLITKNRIQAVEKAVLELNKLIEQHEVMVNVKKTLKEMGKDEAAPEEIEMLKSMFMKKSVVGDENMKSEQGLGKNRKDRLEDRKYK